ncbi:MAG TPA: tetratricopeptide repeat protein [Terriglobales bacterium]|nr:tetratricopeptide repeat protein [Terriglobales bacterium]
MRLPLLAVALLAVALGAQAAQAPASGLLASGLDHYFNLEYPQAIADFTALTRQQPDSPGAWNHLGLAELYAEMYRIGALESELYGNGDPFLEQKLLPPDPAAVARIEHDLDQARTLAAAAIQKNPDDAQAQYDLAVAWAQLGTLEFTISKSYWAALGDAKAARKAAAKALELNPHFTDAELIVGAQNYIAGSLPWAVKVFSTLIGYRGDKELGRRQIADVAAHGVNSRTDAAVLLAVVDRRDGLNRSAAPILASLESEYPRNVLFAVEAGEAMEAAGEHDSARAQFQQIIAKAAAGAPGFGRAPLGKTWYDLGNIERTYSHWQQAADDFDRAENAAGAQPRYRQAAALAAGQSDQQAGNAAAARAQFQRCIAFDPESAAGKAAAAALDH